jgi:pilus assembly protein CpaE
MIQDQPRPATARESAPAALVLTLDPILTDRIGAALAGIAVLHRVDPIAAAAAPVLAEDRPALLLVDSADVGSELGSLIAHLRRASPTAALVVLGDEGSADLILACMRAGAQDFLNREIGEVALRRALRARFDRGTREVAMDRQGPCLTVAGARPADPSREVALALAALRAKRADGPVLFLDLGADAQETELALDLKPTYGVANALEDLDRLDAALLRSAVAQDRASGLSVMLLSDRARRDGILAGDLGSLLALLRGVYAEVVVHAGADLGPNLHPVVAAPPRFALVATQAIASAQRAGGLLQELGTAGIPGARRAVLVVAEHDARLQPAPATIAGTLGLADVVALPDVRLALRNAANQGRFAAAALAERGFGRRLEALAGALGTAAARPVGRALPVLGLFRALGAAR